MNDASTLTAALPGLTEKLALHGGPKTVVTPIPPRKRHGEKDKQYLNEVIDSEMLFYYWGTKVREFERHFAAMYGKKHCLACSSGSAAVHVALGALDLAPGTEIITTPITDMGTLTGILYQGLIPVFADVDPETLNLHPDAVRQCVSPRTGAIVAVHHSGLAADLNELLRVSEDCGVPLVEDCAQAYGTEHDGHLVGMSGCLNTFSLNHFKHISTGSGGMVLTDDDELYYRSTLFFDKCYQRAEGIRNPYFLAPNYQMTELQGAVALAQVERLPELTGRRCALGNRLRTQIEDVPGIRLQRIAPRSKHSYFLFLIAIDGATLNCSAAEFATALHAEGVHAQANLITGGRPVYLYDLFQRRSAFPRSHYPFQSKDLGTDRAYPVGLCPNAEAAFSSWIVIELLENYLEQNVDEVALAIRKVALHFQTSERLRSSQQALATDLANDNVSPVVATNGTATEVLAAMTKGMNDDLL